MLIFRTKFAQKGNFGRKQKKVNTTWLISEYSSQTRYQVSAFVILDKICPKTVFPAENGKICYPLFDGYPYFFKWNPG